MRRAACALLALYVGSSARDLSAQAAPFSDGFFADIRRLATVVPGAAPTSLRVVGLSFGRVPAHALVDGAGTDTVAVMHPVYQIRFPRGWITVDAAMPQQFFPPNYPWPVARWDSMQTALREAQLSVITHEHFDHTMGILRSPSFDAIRLHAVFTRAQVTGMRTGPAPMPGATIDSATAGRLLTVDYDPYLAIAPGVVLVRAAGHSPGSQFVYVRLASGREIMLIGDASWNIVGIQKQLPNSASYKQQAGLVEDDGALVRQRRWLKELMDAGVAIVSAHDEQWTARLIADGVLTAGFDLQK